jgi:hypothetical protein
MTIKVRNYCHTAARKRAAVTRSSLRPPILKRVISMQSSGELTPRERELMAFSPVIPREGGASSTLEYWIAWSSRTMTVE